MARVTGMIQIEGRLGDVSFYKFKGVNYCKMTSRVSSNMLKNAPQFERFRKSGKRMGQATKFLQPLYYLLPKEKRVHGLFGTMAGQVYSMMRLEKSEDQIREFLFLEYGIREEVIPVEVPVVEEKVVETKEEKVSDVKEEKIVTVLKKSSAVKEVRKFAEEKHLQRQRPSIREVLHQHKEGISIERLLASLSSGAVLTEEEVELGCMLESG